MKVINRDGSLEYQLFSTLDGESLTDCSTHVHHDHHPARINSTGMAEWCHYGRTERPSNEGSFLLWAEGQRARTRNLRRNLRRGGGSI
jgi:hypothetical protein